MTMMQDPPKSSTFSINDLIDAELEASAEADPKVVAAMVAAAVPSRHLRAALADVLPQIVRVRAGLRMSSSRQSVARAVSHSDWGEVGLRYKRWLRERICVHGEDGDTYKFLGDCTREDVLSAVAWRRAQASELLTVADRYEALAVEMQKRKAATVADLPVDVLAVVFA